MADLKKFRQAAAAFWRDRNPAGSRRNPRLTGVAAVMLLVLGTGIGAGAVSLAQPDQHIAFDPTLGATRVADLSEDDRIGIEGRVAEIFGNKFVVEDSSGRVLVETGHKGRGASLVALNEQVNVQGRFENGFVRASAIRHRDGRIESLGPPHPPRRPHQPLADADRTSSRPTELGCAFV